MQAGPDIDVSEHRLHNLRDICRFDLLVIDFCRARKAQSIAPAGNRFLSRSTFAFLRLAQMALN